jgi:dihydroorotate dehydrogenase electron transfer subunit
MPDARMRTFRVERVVEHGPALKSFYFTVPFTPLPGQFVNLWIPGVDEKPFSVSDVVDGRIELSVKAYGPFTQRLMQVKAGDLLGVRGPYGTSFSLVDDALLVGGGIGLAPLRFLSRRLREKSFKQRLVIGLRSRSDLIFPDEFAGAEIASEDGTIGTRGMVTALLEPLLARERPRLLCAAGPERMLVAVMALARRFGVEAQVSLERYMKCGVGLCGQCCLDGAGLRVCVEGPVFDAKALEAATDLGQPHRTASGRRPPSA